MRVLVLGGTGFVGRHVVARLLAAGDEVLVAHRGPAEPADFPDVPHLHVDRASFAGAGSFEPDAVVDCCAFGLDARDPKFWDGGLNVIAHLIDELEGL